MILGSHFFGHFDLNLGPGLAPITAVWPSIRYCLTLFDLVAYL